MHGAVLRDRPAGLGEVVEHALVLVMIHGGPEPANASIFWLQITANFKLNMQIIKKLS